MIRGVLLGSLLVAVMGCGGGSDDNPRTGVSTGINGTVSGLDVALVDMATVLPKATTTANPNATASWNVLGSARPGICLDNNDSAIYPNGRFLLMNLRDATQPATSLKASLGTYTVGTATDGLLASASFLASGADCIEVPDKGADADPGSKVTVTWSDDTGALEGSVDLRFRGGKETLKGTFSTISCADFEQTQGAGTGLQCKK